MIYTNNSRNINWNSPLYEYIKFNHLYNGQNLTYTNKYSAGTFSITNPESNFKNCEFINGYPHFRIPLEICLDEINFFIQNCSLYENNFIIRYGDTHPHKPVPKLGQVRNLILEESLSSLIGSKANSYFAIGDISIKTLKDFILNNNIDISEETLFKLLVNNELPEELTSKLKIYNEKSLGKIKEFITQANLKENNFIYESSLYRNQVLYNKIKNNPNYIEELKSNGEIKYTLQELMFIESLLKDDRDILINVIGANQSDHICRVNNLLKETNEFKDVRFLAYGMCRNAEENNMNKWKKSLEEYIDKNNFKINGENLGFMDFLKIINISISINNDLDFNNLQKYNSKVSYLCNSLNIINFNINSQPIYETCELINMMALVSYNVNRAIEIGDPNYFYKYILNIMKIYQSNPEKYIKISSLYQDFIDASLSRLGLSNLGRVLKK